MLNLSLIKAISLDLDDTLWPVWPVIANAEKALENWLGIHAPMTAALFANPVARHDIRLQVLRLRPGLQHDLSAVRKEAIRLALYRAGENPLLAEAAFATFYAERNKVPFFADALASLGFLSARFPLVALSNGNACIERVGIKSYFKGSLSAVQFGVGKPDVRIFQAAARLVDMQPEEVLHVGDDAAMDVLGAMNSGMQAVWLNREDTVWPYQYSQPHQTVASLKALCDLFAVTESPGMQETSTAQDQEDFSTTLLCLEPLDIELPLPAEPDFAQGIRH